MECEHDSGQRADKPMLQASAEEVPVSHFHLRGIHWHHTKHHTAAKLSFCSQEHTLLGTMLLAVVWCL